MYSFEGNYKSKRSLVLDHTQKLSTNALVQKTREERRLREKMIKQESAIIKIQAYIRSYIVQNKMKRYFIGLFNELSNQLDHAMMNKSIVNMEQHEYECKLLRLLQSFNICYRGKNVNQEHLLIVCRLLLSKHGKSVQIKWLTNGSIDNIFTLANSLSIIVKYLSKLSSSTKSSDYALPIRVLEELFTISTGTSTTISLYSKQLSFNIAWICQYLTRHHYFNQFAYFIDQQLPSTAGYLQDPTTQSHVFDPVEFLKVPKVQDFINLLMGPLKCVLNLSENGSQVSSTMIDFYQELVITAINDILISTVNNTSNNNNNQIISERLTHSISIELFQLPKIHQIIMNACLTSVKNKNNQLNIEQQQQQKQSSEYVTLIPSINLLHLLVTTVLPGILIQSNLSATTTTTTSNPMVCTTESSMIQDTTDDNVPHHHHLEEQQQQQHREDEDDDTMDDESLPVLLSTEFYTHYTWSSSPLEAALMIRCLAWLLMHCLKESYLPIIRPLIYPKPLQLRMEQEFSDGDDDDDDDDVDDRVKSDDQNAKMSTEFIRNTSSEIVQSQQATQLKNIFVALSHHLPALAASALTTLENSTNDLNNPDDLELIRSTSYLHYCLSQACNLPRIVLIRINSIYSQHTIYLRYLWHLIETTQCSIRSTLSHSNSSMYSIFNILSSGELPPCLVELQSYLPLIFTFADCLHHRLLCLTDSEICNNVSSEMMNFTIDHNNNTNNYHHQTKPLSRLLGCGFHPDELLHVGAKLRDLMLGLIDISHPDQLPKRIHYNLQQTDPSSVDLLDQPNYGAVLRRIEQRVELAALYNSPGGGSEMFIRNNAEWSVTELRLLLHCWSSLFRRVQQLVFQIYDWDCRCQRQQDNNLSSTNNPSNVNSTFSTTDIVHLPIGGSVSSGGGAAALGKPRIGQTFWLKDNLVDLLNPIIASTTPSSSTSSTTSSQLSWLINQSAENKLALASAPFGYFSILNPDLNQVELNAFALTTNREVRQVVLLKKIPFVIPFEKRVKLFQILINDNNAYDRNPFRQRFYDQPKLLLVIRRTHLYEDAFEKLSKENEPNLRLLLKVTFLNPTGLAEVGIDGGGLTREFLTELIRTGFNPTRGFFIYASDQTTLYPNPQAAAITSDYLKHYYFLGRILAKVIYEGILVELQFAYFFLAKIVSQSTGGSVGFDYLQSLDPQLYKQLLFLKNYEGNVRDLSLDFTVVQSIFDQPETIELKPGGKHIPVTEENRVEYVHLMANYKLNIMIYPQVRAFTAGLNDVIPIDWLRLFDAEGLQTLISGADMVIDVDDLKKHTYYFGNSSTYTETLNSFWSVLKNFSESNKRLFLRFVTACSRPPMFGFSELQPPFSIQITEEIERLPTASTCTNLLRLPNFRDEKLLHDRLLYALNANAGFEYG